MLMRTLPYLGLLIAASCVTGAELKDIAAKLQVPKTLTSAEGKLPLPAVPAGVQISIKGIDYEELLSDKGTSRPVLSPVPITVCYELRRGKETVISPDYTVMLQPKTALSEWEKSRKPPILPEPLQWKGAEGAFKLPATLHVTGSSDAAATLREELQQHFGVTNAQDAQSGTKISFALIKSNFYGDEGYGIEIEKNRIRVMASRPEGLIWGAQSLLQALKASGDAKTVACGRLIDIPRYPVRGFMLDVGRSPVPLSRLYELVDQLAWHKMNELQLHLNDNFIFHEKYVDAGKDPFKESYTGYRLESSVKGKDGTRLTSQDLHYTKAQMAELIEYAASKGVRIIPEFDTPGHALSFTRVRPDLIYQGPMGGKEKRRCEMLDAANPETLKFVASVLDEYLVAPRRGASPLFERGSVIHLGADEFYGKAEDYRKYTDGLIKYAKKRGYTPRIWGSLSMKRGKTPIDSKGVEVSLWNHGWSGAWETVKLGFDVINTNDGALYIVPLANYYRMDKNHQWLYNNWKPNQIGKDLLPAGHPQLKGAMFAVWNDEIDLLHHGQSYDDFAGAITDSIGILGHKMWAPTGVPKDAAGKPLSFPDYRAKRLAPLGSQLSTGQDGAKAIGLEKKNITRSTPLNLESLEAPYHLVMELELEPVVAGREQILLQGKDGGALYAADKQGKVGFRRDDALSFQWDARIPTGKPVKVELIGELGKTTLKIDGQIVAHEKLKLMNFNTTQKKLYNTLRLPLTTLAPQLKGKVTRMQILPLKK